MPKDVEIQGDVARQAISSLKGYAYQLYDSALAWMSLAENEFLFLEVAEDYAIATSDAIQAVQVKTATASITLNSKEVIETINSFFELSGKNPDKSISIKHLTTAAIGKERKKTERVEGQSGLEYWKAVNAGADVEPLRQQLLKRNLSTEAIQFLKSGTAQQIKNDFVNRIEWLGGAKGLEMLRRELSNRLVYLGEGKNVSSSVCDGMVDSLVSRVLTVASSGGIRRLERADFVRFFDERSRVSLPISTVENMMSGIAPTVGTTFLGFVSSVAVLRPVAAIDPVDLAARPGLIDNIQEAIVLHNIAWLHGATGTGKSSLSKLTACLDSKGWRALQLRSLDARETAEVLYRASSQIAIDKPKGVVLDDLSSLTSGLVADAFIHLTETARKASVAVIVTSNTAPPNSILTAMSIIAKTSISVGNLTEEEVANFVSAKGGSAKYWTRYVDLATGGGHPLLVDAMVRGLQIKKWPVKELQKLNSILGTNEDIEKVKSEARQRLFDELSPDESALLVRLSLVLGTFDWKIAMYLGELDPAIDMPGKALENLIGAWIETETQNRYRLSSLVSNVGQRTLGSKASKKLNYALADYYIKDWQLDADRFDDMVLHGMLGKNEKALTVVSLAVISAKAEDVELIAKYSSNLTAFRTDQPLYPKSPGASLYLRIAQVLLLVSSNRPKKFQEALDAFERESVDGDVANENTFSMVYAKAMSLSGLANVVDDLPQFALTTAEHTRKLDISLGKTVTKTMGSLTTIDSYLQFMFAFQLTQISDLETLQRVMKRLIGKTKSQREFLLKAFEGDHFEKSLIIKNVWVKTLEKKQGVDAKYAEEFLSLARELYNCGEPEFAMATFEAAAATWDEYLSNPERAIKCLEEAVSLLGENQAAARALSRTLFRQKEYERQLKIGMPLSDNFVGSSTETSFFFRELAMGNSHLGNHDAAKALYIKAHDSIISNITLGITPMATGLLADAAVEAHWMGKNEDAVKLFAKSLDAAKALNPEDGLHSAAAIRMVAHSVIWLLFQITGCVSEAGKHEMIAGVNSNPTPHKELEGRVEIPLDYAWYILADVEAALDVDCGVINLLLSNTWKDRAILAGEIMFHVSIASSAERLLSSQEYLSRLPRAIDAKLFAEKEGVAFREQALSDSPRKRLPRLKAEKFAQHRGGYTQNVLAFTMRIAFLDSVEAAIEFIKKAQALERPLVTDKMLDAFLDGAPSSESHEIALSGTVGSAVKALTDKQPIAAADLLLICLRLLELMKNEYSEPDMIAKAKGWMLQQWKKAVVDQAFQLSSPQLAQRALSDYEQRSGDKLSDIADLILTLNPFVKINIGQTYNDWLTGIKQNANAISAMKA